MDPRFEHELSQFLDGRLPSGRRDQILERIAADVDAANILEEMEQAQDLARSLPQHPISRGFSESLWERIRSGEGTPEAVFREPLPFWTKARYVASGAAAAAAAIIAMNLLTGPRTDTSANPATGEPATGETRIADAGTDPEAPARLRRVERNPLATPVLYEIMPQSVAQAGRLECVDAVSTLQHRAPDVERRIAAGDPRELVVELDAVVGRVRGATELIRWMQREKLVKLYSEFDSTLAMTENIVERFQRANQDNDASQLRVAVQDLQNLRIDRLRQDFDVACCTDPEEFLANLTEQIFRSPDVGRALRFVVTTDTGPMPSEMQLHRVAPHDANPFGRSFMILRGIPGFGTLQIQGDSSSQVELRVHYEEHSATEDVEVHRQGLAPRRR